MLECKCLCFHFKVSCSILNSWKIQKRSQLSLFPKTACVDGLIVRNHSTHLKLSVIYIHHLKLQLCPSLHPNEHFKWLKGFLNLLDYRFSGTFGGKQFCIFVIPSDLKINRLFIHLLPTRLSGWFLREQDCNLPLL